MRASNLIAIAASTHHRVRVSISGQQYPSNHISNRAACAIAAILAKRGADERVHSALSASGQVEGRSARQATNGW